MHALLRHQNSEHYPGHAAAQPLDALGKRAFVRWRITEYLGGLVGKNHPQAEWVRVSVYSIR